MPAVGEAGAGTSIIVGGSGGAPLGSFGGGSGAGASVGGNGVGGAGIAGGQVGDRGGSAGEPMAGGGAGSGWVAAGGGAGSDAGGSVNPPLDVTFYVVSDTHADPPESYDLRAMARVVNEVGKGGVWPAKIDGVDTEFVGGAIAKPLGVVFTGDLMGWGVTPTELLTFRRYFQAGNSAEAIAFPAFVGLGNHDVDDADRTPELGATYRNAAWSFIDERHKGTSAPVRVSSFDAASHNYSWDFGRAHLVQTHRFPGDVGYGLASSLDFLRTDLAAHASDGRPVFVFHHYGMDTFGTEDRWWTKADRDRYRATLATYHVAGIITGHTHFAMQYSWEGLRVFQVNNAKAENGTGNQDGNGSFAIVRVTDAQLDVVTCRWLDDAGHYELIAPFFSGPTDTGAAP